MTLADSEHIEQVALMAWARKNESRLPELALLFAIPNGAKLVSRVNQRGQRFSVEANRLIAEGLKPGVPDLFLPVARGGCFGLFIELKRDGGRASDAQNEWISKLREQGYSAWVAYGSRGAIEIIERYLGHEPTEASGPTT